MLTRSQQQNKKIKMRVMQDKLWCNSRQKLVFITKLLSGLKSQISIIKTRLKQNESMKNKLFAATVNEITNKYSLHIQQLKRQNKKLKEQLNRSTQKRNNQYKRILNTLVEKEQQLANLQQKILQNQNQNNHQNITQITHKFQAEINSLKIKKQQIQNLLYQKIQQNQQITYQLNKFKIFTNQSSKSSFNTQTTPQILPNKCKLLSEIQYTQPNTKYVQSCRFQQRKKISHIDIQKNKQLHTQPNQSQTPKGSFRKTSIQAILYKKTENLNEQKQNKDQIRMTGSIKKLMKNKLNSCENSLQKVSSKKFQTALKQYNLNKKSKLSYYFK